MTELGLRMGEIARLILGPENKRLSNKSELRFGTGGSVSVMIAGDKAGQWFDHENQVGGGSQDFLREKAGLVDGAATEWLQAHGFDKANGSNAGAKATIVATYDYVDETGQLLSQVVRRKPKDFRQRRPDGMGGWIWSTKDIKRVPYRLPELLAAVAAGETIYVAEGEKAVDALRQAGLAATCSPGGAGKWPGHDYGRYFSGADVVVLPDNDDAGRSHANDVASDLLGIARVRVFHLAQHHEGFPDKGDPADWLALGRTADDLKWLLDGVEPLTPPSGQSAPRPCLAATDWLTRALPEPDFLMGEVFSTSSRTLLVAPTGIGKTNLGLALAARMASGQDLLHWRCRRKARVLYIDGEMSARLIKRRLIDAARRAGTNLDGLFVINRDDFPDMPALNTTAGQAFITQKIEQIGGVDFIIFDNIQSLLLGDMKDEEPWQQTLPWVRDLTRRNIGQCWVHHTGHDATHSYGTKTREWQMDTVMLLEAIERPDADIAFSLKFQKARERSPDNRPDFEPVTVILAQDKWSVEGGAITTINLSPDERAFLSDITNYFARPESPVDTVVPMPDSVSVRAATRVQIRGWLKRCGRFSVSDDGALSETDRTRLRRILNTLKDKGKIGMTDRYLWLL